MESEKEIIEWNMIRPDGSERLLHIGKNEVKSEELNISSNANSIILFEIYFSPQYNAYLRFYGYTPLRLHMEKTGELSKHIYIDNNQSFVYLEQLENTTIDVYDNEEFATFSFEKKVKKPELDHDLIEKEKRIQWLNDNIEYEDLKKEENEYGSKSLYSQNFFNYNKKKSQNKSEKDKNDSMSDISKDKSDSLSTLKEKKDEKNEEKRETSEINKEKSKSEKEEKSEKESVKEGKEEEQKEDEIKDKIKEKGDEGNEEKSIKSIKSIEQVVKSEKNLSEEKEMEIEDKSNEENKSKNKEEKVDENAEKQEKFENKPESNNESSKKESDKQYVLNYDKIVDRFVLSNNEEEEEEEDDESKNEENEEEKESGKNSDKDDKKINKKSMAERSSNPKKSTKNNKTENIEPKNKLNTSITSKCPICLDIIVSAATLKPCGHQFCKGCIEEWLKKSSACPDCKKNAKKLYFYDEKLKKFMGKRVKRKKYKAEKQALEDWFLNCDKACLICGKEDNDTYLLVCDTCNFRICHTFCVGLDSIPDTEWKCPECMAKEQGKTFSLTKSNLQKFREKEQKLLKVKQSEVKVGDNNKTKGHIVFVVVEVFKALQKL